jgi:hypothetical protein
VSNNPQYLIIHHSAGSIYDTVDTIRHFHVEKRGWVDIGYHKIILHPNNPNIRFQNFKDLIKQGRPDSTNGAHCIGYNVKSLGICVIGNCEESEPHDLQIQALKYLLKLLGNQYLISIDRIIGHKDVYATLCPGKFLYKHLELIKKAFAL